MCTDRWMDRQTTKNQTNKRNLAMMVTYVPSSLNSIGQTVFELESGNENVDGQMDGQQDKNRTNGITPISKGT